MLKLTDRPTKAKVSKERNKILKIYPAIERPLGSISLIERVAGRYDEAINEISEKYDLKHDAVKILLWVYPYTFFERKFMYENMKKYGIGVVNGTRNNKNLLYVLIRKGYVVLYQHRSHKFYEQEQKDGYSVIRENISDDTYTISKKGVAVVKDFFETFINLTPKVLDTENRITYSLSQKKTELDNINGGWDAILSSF